MVNKPLRIFAHLKEICRLLCIYDLSAAIRAFPVHELRLRVKRFTRCAVKSLVGSLVDIAVIIELFEYLLNLTLVIFVSRSDKLIIRGIHEIPYLLDLPRNIIHIFLWRNAGFLCLKLYFLTVLVGSGLEKYVTSLHSLKSCYAVRQNYFVCISYMRLARRIRYRRSHIIFIRNLLHSSLFPVFLSEFKSDIEQLRYLILVEICSDNADASGKLRLSVSYLALTRNHIEILPAAVRTRKYSLCTQNLTVLCALAQFLNDFFYLVFCIFL